MSFSTKDSFTFDWTAQADYPNWTPLQTKENHNARGEELRLALNAVVNKLNSMTMNDSGADNVLAKEIPGLMVNLTGTVSKTSNSAILNGTGTLFQTELAVGNYITVPGISNEIKKVIAIASDTSLTVDSNFANSASGQTAYRANDVWALIKGLKALIDYQLPTPDGSITDAKLSSASTDIKQRFASHLAETATLTSFGIVGDGVSDDTIAIKNAIATGRSLVGQKGKTYLVSDTIVLGDNLYDFQGATIKATVGMAGKPVVSASNLSFLRLKNLVIDGNGIALRGFYGYHVNESSSSVEKVISKGNVEDGFYLDGCQASNISQISSNSNGRYGVYLASCNALSLDKSIIQGNISDGIRVEKGATGYSSACNILNSTIQNNQGNGVNIIDTASPVKVKNCWIEANTLNGILSGGKAVVIDNYITIYGSGTNYAINLSSTAKGVYKNNTFGSSGGTSANKLRLDNTGLSDDLLTIGLDISPNFFATSGNIINPILVSGPNLYIIANNDVYYHAVKRIVVSDTGAYTKILTAPISSSVEITVSSADTNNGLYGQSIFKTWSSKSNDTRNSFGEIGSANPFTNGVFYNPVYLSGKGAYIRWNGDDLEIRPENSGSDIWMIDVKVWSNDNLKKPTWLI